MKKVKLILISLLTLCSSSSLLYGKSWPMFMNNPARTGYSYEQAGGTLTYVWSYETFADLISSPVVKDGVLYIGNRANSFNALNALTGASVWEYSFEGWVDSTALIYDEKVYVCATNGEINCFNAQTGDIFWNVDVGGQNMSSPVIADGYLYVGRGTSNNDIIAVDIEDGSVDYSFDTTQPVWSSPVINGEYIYIGSNSGSIYKLDKQLNKIWEYDTLTGLFNLSTPSYDDATIYMAPGNSLRRLYMIDIDDPHNNNSSSVELNTGAIDIYTSSVGMDDSNVYNVMAATKQVIYCLDKSDLSLEWERELGNAAGTESFFSSPALSYDTIYVGTEDGYLYAISTGNASFSSYLVDSSSPAIISSPAVSNGYVYIATKSGKIYAYQASRVACISSPDEDDVITASASTISGSAFSPDFQYYTLYYGTGTNPGTWQYISSATARVNSGSLGSWNASGLLDGNYTIRLDVKSTSENAQARNVLTLDSIPAVPLNVAAVSTAFGSIKLTWDLSLDDGTGDLDVAGYKIFRRTKNSSYNYSSALASVSSGVSTYTDEGILTSTEYYYELRSYDSRNDSASSVEVSTIAQVNTVSIIASEGGTVQLSDGSGVYFPPGSLAKNSEVAVRRLATSEIPAGNVEINNNWFALDKAWEFLVQPHENFSSNATVTLCYDDSDVAGLEESQLRVYWYDESANLWRIVDSSVADPVSNKVTAAVPHFTIYRIAQYIQPENIISKASTYVYPNPAEDTDEINFKFRLFREAKVEIKVFNVAGELIKEFEEIYDSSDVGKSQTISWDISGVASGVYVWYIKAKVGDKEDKVIKKLAIIK